METWIYIIIEVVIAIGALIGNTFVIILFCYDSRLRINRNFYLISLSCANILTSLLEVPFTVLIFFGLPYDRDTLCYLELSVICMTRTLTNYAIAAIALDRLKAVTKPFEYRSNVSKKSSLITISFCWIIAIVIGFLTLAWKVDGEKCSLEKIHKSHLMLCHAFGKFLPYVIVISCYGFIFASICRVMKTKNYDKNASIKSRSKLKAERKEIRATLRISWIVGVLTVSEMPLNIANIYFSLGGHVHDNLYFSFLVLSHSNALINPFLYAFNLKDFKRAAQKMFKKDDKVVRTVACNGVRNNLSLRKSSNVQSDTDC